MTAKPSYSIGDLAAAAGVSRRTVRFYVQRQLLPPPEGLGRGARYTDEHLARLIQIKGWQEAGVPLDEIRARLSPAWSVVSPALRARAFAELQKWRPPGEIAAAPHPPDLADAPGASWFRQPLVAGFELNVGAGRKPLTARQLAALARALGEILEHGGEDV